LIHVRGDSGFGVPRMYRAAEELNVDYTYGLGMNARLKKLSENTLKTAVERFEATGQTQRLFCAFWYRAGSWQASRWVIVKCEVNAQGTNRRAVVTNRPGGFVLPAACYDDYADRGESENRNKELKDGLQADRLSDHRYFANLFRLYLHTAAYHLLVEMRRRVADPPTPLPMADEPLPTEALPGHHRRRWHNRRRAHDPLGEGQPCTWRTRLIKVGATVRESTRRVVVQLSSSWPYLEHYYRVADQLHFGSARNIANITAGDADDWRAWMLKSQAATTVSRDVKRAKQCFRAAVRKKLISENPFQDLPAPEQVNTAREFFVTPSMAKAVLRACPDIEWQLLFALCRYGGLRCPSEVLRLTWDDVDWDHGRITVHASKTEHHKDGGIHQVPIFPELRPYLEQMREQAHDDTVYVINRYRDANANLRTQLHRIIRRAGLEPWPKAFQSLRATRETELAEKYPIHVVCAWIGNTPSVANKHYLQVTDEHFQQAVQNPVR
jgi:integrase